MGRGQRALTTVYSELPTPWSVDLDKFGDYVAVRLSYLPTRNVPTWQIVVVLLILCFV